MFGSVQFYFKNCKDVNPLMEKPGNRFPQEGNVQQLYVLLIAYIK